MKKLPDNIKEYFNDNPLNAIISTILGINLFLMILLLPTALVIWSLRIIASLFN